MNFHTLKIDIRNQAIFCWLNRPNKRNALNVGMLEELLAFFHSLELREDIRILVLQGKGEVFSAGADLSMMSDVTGKSANELQKEAGLFFDCFEALYRLSIPAVCYVHGSVRGGANGLVAACDFTLAEHGTSFSFGEVRMGLVPATVAPFVLRRTGHMNARKMMLGGFTFSATEAIDFGLIDSLCAEHESDKAIEKQIEMILHNAPDAMKKTKKLLLEIDQYPDSGSLKEFCTGLIAETRTSEEAREGIAAFFEKRDPLWKST